MQHGLGAQRLHQVERHGQAGSIRQQVLRADADAERHALRPRARPIGEVQHRPGAQRDRSTAEDLDMVEAISDFQGKQTGYDAALKTYSMVQRMTLFDYMKT